MGWLLWLLHDALLLTAGGLVVWLEMQRRAPKPQPRCSRCGRYGGGRTHLCEVRSRLRM